jgi:hypothetical protein
MIVVAIMVTWTCTYFFVLLPALDVLESIAASLERISPPPKEADHANATTTAD